MGAHRETSRAVTKALEECAQEKKYVQDDTGNGLVVKDSSKPCAELVRTLQSPCLQHRASPATQGLQAMTLRLKELVIIQFFSRTRVSEPATRAPVKWIAPLIDTSSVVHLINTTGHETGQLRRLRRGMRP